MVGLHKNTERYFKDARRHLKGVFFFRAGKNGQKCPDAFLGALKD